MTKKDKIEEKYSSNKQNNLTDELQNCIRGIRRIEENTYNKQMIITFGDRQSLLRMEDFLKIIYSIMSDFNEEKNLQTKLKGGSQK